jgi:hypothetical protein
MRRSPAIVLRYGIAAALFLATLLVLPGCAPKIGDSCTQSTDCSPQGNRACDTSQIGGYCTIFGCATNSCPDMASCVVFRVSVPGCQYNDYEAPARTGRSLCMLGCKSDSDCRDGYVCRDPRGPPWSAVILDDKQQNVCIQAPVDYGDAGLDGGSNASAAVCSGTGNMPDTGPADAPGGG